MRWLVSVWVAGWVVIAAHPCLFLPGRLITRRAWLGVGLRVNQRLLTGCNQRFGVGGVGFLARDFVGFVLKVDVIGLAISKPFQHGENVLSRDFFRAAFAGQVVAKFIAAGGQF